MNFVESEKTIVRACYTGTGQQNDVLGDGFKSGSEMLTGFDQKIELGCRFDTRMPEYPEKGERGQIFEIDNLSIYFWVNCW